MRDLPTDQFTCVFSVAKHDRAVGGLFNLVHAVRNVNDADVLSLEIFYNFKQASCFAECQTRRRLVHDDDARAGAECACNLNQLLLG